MWGQRDEILRSCVVRPRGGVGGGGAVTSYIWHSTDVFFSVARYMIGPLFSTKSIWMARFFWIPMWKASFFLTSWYMHIFFAQRILEAAYPLGITWIDCDICVITSKKNGFKKSKGSIWIGQHFGWSSIWMGPFFEGHVYEWGRFWNTGSYTRTKITPKLPPEG